MAGNTQYHIASLLEKMTSADKDYRFMATNDLMAELSKDAIMLDDDSERKVAKMLLRLLEDKNGEVQNLAVKCLATLVRKIKEAQAEVVVEALCENMSGDKEELRDVSSIALKTLILGLPPPSAALTANVIRRVTPKLNGILRAETKGGDVSVKMEALDILADVLHRHGPLTAQYHAALEESLMPLLSSQRLAVRKKAMVALGHLGASATGPIFQKIVEAIVAAVSAKDSASTTRTYVATAATLCRASWQRFAQNIPALVPLLLKLLEGEEEDDELREACLAALEAFALRCPKEMTPWVGRLSQLCSNYLAHDPNYHYDSEDEDTDGGMEVENGIDDDDDDDAEEYSDDEDVSWKVRRGAAKALEALISARRDLLPSLLPSLGPVLISRLKEREENVKVDIFAAYSALLRQANLCLPPGLAGQAVAEVMGAEEPMESVLLDLSPDQAKIVKEVGRQIPSLLRALNRQLREKSSKTRSAAFALLTELVRVVPGALSSHMALVMPGVEAGLKERQANMKLDTLAFLSAAVAAHPSQVLQPFAGQLVPLAAKAAGDSFYKVAAEALGVIQGLCVVLAPSEPAHLRRLYEAVFARLKATDIDQEVKENAIAATGQLFASFGDRLVPEAEATLPVLLERLGNEMTRLTTVRCLRAMADSQVPNDLAPILPAALPLLADFLRKNQRGLRLATLQLLQALLGSKRHLQALETSGADPTPVLAELPPLLSEADLQLAQLSLDLLADFAAAMPGPLAAAGTLPQALAQIQVLVQSPLLQGPSLEALLNFLASVGARASGPGEWEHLLEAVWRPVRDPSVVAASASAAHGVGWPHGLHKQAYLSIAKCVAALGAAVPGKATNLAKELAKPLKGNSVEGGASELFSLLALGELGRRCPEVFQGFQPKPEALISAAFRSSSEEIKTAASYALGGLAVGNLEQFLPFILNEINGSGGRQYLLLHALKEVIGSEAGAGEDAAAVFRTHIAQIWDVLVAHAKCPEEEGTRNVVAECLGKLTRMEPKSLLPKLRSYVNDPAWAVRATVVTAVKHTIVEGSQPSLDPLLKSSIHAFLASLQDPDINVRRVALVTFNSAAHNKAGLVRELLPSLLPQLYKETKVRPELVREVEMGPFKHTVDDGLELRKAAFECLYTLLEKCLDRVDVLEFLEQVEAGLRDHHDIKLLSYLMVARLAVLCPAQVVQRIAALVEPLKATIQAKAKQNSVKQEVEKAEELRRSALRALAALAAVRDAEKLTPLAETLAQIRGDQNLAALYNQLQKEPHLGQELMETDH